MNAEEMAPEPEENEESVSPVPEEEIPVAVRMAAARLAAATHSELQTPKARMFRETVAAWIKETRGGKYTFKELCEVVGLTEGTVNAWQPNHDIDVGRSYRGVQQKRKKKEPGDRIYMEEHTLPEAPAEPPQEKIASQFTLRVIEMSGDDKTVQTALQGLREFLQRRSN